MSVTLLLHGLPIGIDTPFDGQYLVEYDPARKMACPAGCPDMTDGWPHLVTTPDREQARQFADLAEAHACWTAVDPADPVRPDGKPNRPLSAFTITIEHV